MYFLLISLGAFQDAHAFSSNSEIKSIEIKEFTNDHIDPEWISKWELTPKSSYDKNTIKINEATKTVLAKVIFTKPISDRYLFVGARFIDLADFYSFKNSQVIRLATGGNMVGNDNLNLFTNSPLMRIMTSRPEEAIYIKVKSPKFLHLAVDVKTSPEFKFEMETARIIAYAFFGFIFMMTIVQGVVYLSFKNKNPIYYLIFSWSCAMAFYCSSGVAGYFFDNPIPIGASFYANWFFTATLHLSLVYFTYTLFDLKTHKWILTLNQILGAVLIGISLIVMYDNQMIGSFFNVKQTIQLTMLLSMIYVTFLGLKVKRDLALIFMASWAPVSIYAIVSIFNLYPAHKIYDPAIMAIPVIFEMIVSSIASYFNMKTIQQELVESEIRRKQNEVLKQAMRTISHDLANHFFVAEHSVDAIKKQNKNLDPKSLDRLDKVKKSLIQSKMLLGRVKSWIQIGNGRINVQNEAINLVPFIKETIDLFEEKARAKEITIRTEWHEDINEIKIWADPIALYNQVLSNTISNAIKFSYRNSDIVIKVHNCSENVYVTIKDKGMGIKDEHLANFHKNGHIESSIGTENEKGTGFGMGLMKSYMEAFTGSVMINSQVAEDPGTEIILSFKYAGRDEKSELDEAFAKVGIS